MCHTQCYEEQDQERSLFTVEAFLMSCKGIMLFTRHRSKVNNKNAVCSQCRYQFVISLSVHSTGYLEQNKNTTQENHTMTDVQ